MKLFIWDDPYDVSYGNSFLFAAAETLEQAVELAKTAPCGRWSHMQNGVDVSKIKPTRVVELPYAEYQEWSE